ncbi:hypothetical protein ACRRTK_021413 [Alexandromys fortis]
MDHLMQCEMDHLVQCKMDHLMQCEMNHSVQWRWTTRCKCEMNRLMQCEMDHLMQCKELESGWTPPRQESPSPLSSEMKMLTPIFPAAMKTQMMHLKVSGTEQTWEKQHPTTLQVLQEAQGEAAAAPRVAAPGRDSQNRGALELRLPVGSAGLGSRRGTEPRARVCVCGEHGPPRGRRSAGASPSPGAHGPSLSPEAARAAAQQPCLRLARLPPPSLPQLDSRVRGPAAPGRKALRSRTGAGGGGRVRGGRAGERRAETRPPRRSLAGSPPPALRSLPPLPGVIDPSRAPPPPRPF